MEKLLSSRAVSDLLGISQNALAMRVQRGTFPLPGVRKQRGRTVRLFWEAAAVEEYLRQKFPFAKDLKGVAHEV